MLGASVTALRPPKADDPWILVPTERHAEALALSGARGRTVRRLVRELAAAELPALAPTTPEMTRLLTARCAGVSIQHARPLDEAVGRLRRSGTSSAALRATQLERGEKLSELLTSLDENLAARGLRDDRVAAWHAAKHLAEAPGGVRDWPGGRALVRGLVRWDPSTLAFFESLHAALRALGGDGLTLELPSFESGVLREAADGVTAALEARWSAANDPPQLSFVPVKDWTGARARCVEAYDAESEARAVARAVLDGLAQGKSLDRIAIVAAELSEAFLEPLRFELARAGLPFVEPRGRPAIAAPRAHAALELLRLARGPLSRDALIDVLRVPELRLQRWFGSDPHLTGELLHELAKLPLRIDRSGTELMTELDNRLSELTRDDGPRALRLLPAARGLEQWLRTLGEQGQPASRKVHAERAAALFQELRLLSPSEKTLGEALTRATSGRPELLLGLGQDALAGRSVLAALDRTVGAARAIGSEDESVGLGQYLEELELALEGIAEPRGASRAAALRIARPEDAASLDWDLVVLCRASDANLDRAESASGVLGAELESRLPLAQRPSQALEPHFTVFGVGAALMRARELVVTWAQHAEGSSAAPSRFAAALRGTVPYHREPPSSLSARARRAHPLLPPSAGAQARSEAELERSAFYADPDAAPNGYNGEAGPLAPFVGGEAERPLSVTAVERSLRCGFLGFASSVLRASRNDAVEDAIGARERGTLLHAALAAALEAVRGTQGVRSRVELERTALEAARTLLEGKGRSPLRRAGLRTTLRDVAALLECVFDEPDAPPFFAAERGFGRDAEWGALAVGPWFVTGRVDRIDASTDHRRVRVIDYKTRTPTGPEAAQALQPWLYAAKVASEMGAQSVEFAYLALDRRQPKLKVIYDGAPLAEEVQAALQRAQSGIELLREGHVAPRPVSSASCARCDARDICRRPLSAPESTDE